MELPRYVRRMREPIPAPVLRVIRDSVRQYAIATAQRRVLPDFLIIGTKKGGTTSLINWLVRHPAVCRMFPPAQRLKSAHYFDINYWRGLRWYRSHFATEAAQRRIEQRLGARPVTGEASPYYMFHPAVPGRVLETVPEVRIIALLRDPVSRAYSNYWDRRATGTEDLPTFEEALAAEPARLAGVDASQLANPRFYSFDHDNHSYLARGRYLEHLRPWLEQFPAEQLLILRAESLFSEPAETFTRVQRFLNIPEHDPGPLVRYNERSRPPMLDATRAWLADYYRPHNAALYDALGQDMGWESRYPSPR